MDNEIELSGICAIKFYAEWCGPCKHMEPVIKKLESEFPATKFLYIDVDESPDMARKYKIRTLPTVLIVKDGQEVNRVTGMTLIEPLRKIFREAVGS